MEDGNIYPKSAPKRNQLAREFNPLRTAQLSPIYREEKINKLVLRILLVKGKRSLGRFPIEIPLIKCKGLKKGEGRKGKSRRRASAFAR